MRSLVVRLDLALLEAQRRVRVQPLLYRFTLATRILLAVAFIPTGFVKLLGERFTRMSSDYPIGLFFETLYQSGVYWHFLGAAQVLAGVLVLVPATATLGALLFFPLMVNVFVITLSYDFNFTPMITGPMLLANLYLLAWDYDRLRGILGASRHEPAPDRVMPRQRLSRPEWGVYVLGTASALLFFGGTRFSLFAPVYWWSFWIAAGSAVVAVALGLRRREARRLTRRPPASDHANAAGITPAAPLPRPKG